VAADPHLSPKAVLTHLHSEGLHLSASSVRTIVVEVGRLPVEPADQRIAATRALLLRLATSVGYSELHNGQPAPGWRAAVKDRLGVSRAFVHSAWSKGVGPLTRAKWGEIISAIPVDACQPPG
jgi:hypothetical protein